MFERILKDPNALARHQNGPFAEERRRYLAHCVSERMSYETLRGTANYLLIVANALHLQGQRALWAIWVDLRPAPSIRISFSVSLPLATHGV